MKLEKLYLNDTGFFFKSTKAIKQTKGYIITVYEKNNC